MAILSATSDNQRVFGTGSNDVLFTNRLNNTLIGLAGNDVIQGGNGNDKLFGDNGLMTIRVVAGAQLYNSPRRPSPNGAPLVGVFVDGKMVGDPQYVNADFNKGQTQTLTFQTRIVTRGRNIEVRYMNDIADGDVAKGMDRNLILKSITVNDAVTFTPRNADFYKVTEPLYLQAGQPEFRNGSEFMAWDGGQFFNTRQAPGLFAGRGNDVLSGGNGNDTLNGGGDCGTFAVNTTTSGQKQVSVVAQGDVLSGGAGADTFQYVKGDGADFITDFQKGTDKLQILADRSAFNLVDAINGTLVDFGGGQGVFLNNVSSANLMDSLVLVTSA